MTIDEIEEQERVRTAWVEQFLDGATQLDNSFYYNPEQLEHFRRIHIPPTIMRAFYDSGLRTAEELISVITDAAVICAKTRALLEIKGETEDDLVDRFVIREVLETICACGKCIFFDHLATLPEAPGFYYPYVRRSTFRMAIATLLRQAGSPYRVDIEQDGTIHHEVVFAKTESGAIYRGQLLAPARGYADGRVVGVRDLDTFEYEGWRAGNADMLSASYMSIHAVTPTDIPTQDEGCNTDATLRPWQRGCGCPADGCALERIHRG